MQRLLLLRLGMGDFPLLWQPTVVASSIAPTPTCVLCALICARYLSRGQWTQYCANPCRAMHGAVHRIPGLDADAVVDLRDFWGVSNQVGDDLSCKLRVKTEAEPLVLASSGDCGLLIKDTVIRGERRVGQALTWRATDDIPGPFAPAVAC